MKNGRFKKLLSSRYFKYIKIIVGISIFVLFIQSIDISKLEKLVVSVEVWDVLILVLLTIARNVIGAIRFKVLINKISNISLFKIMEQYFVASLYNNFLPTAIGGDAIRMVMLSKEGVKKEKSVIYVVAERIIGFYALLFIGYFSSLFWKIPNNIYQPLAIAFFIYSGVIFAFCVISFNFKNPFLYKIYVVFEEIKSNRITILRVFFISLAYQFVSVWISYFVGISIGLSDSLLEFLTLVPIVWFFTMIPISFGGIGIREFSFAFLLGTIGINTEQSTIISIGTYFTLLLSGLFGGILILKDFNNIGLLKKKLKN